MTAPPTVRLTGLRRRLREAQAPLLGTFVIVPRVEVVEAIALAGFDVVVLDIEHGPLSVESLPPLVAAAHGAGMHVLVRVADQLPHGIGSVLDAGADGVVVPHVDSAAEARAAVAAARFPPAGERSIHLAVRAGGYGQRSDYLADSNASVAVLTMVESAEGLARLDEVLAVDDLDGVFVGPMDLAASLGLDPTTQTHDEVVLDCIRRVRDRAVAQDKAAAIFAPDPRGAREWLDAGIRLVALSVDTLLIAEGFRTAHASARPSAHPMPQHPDLSERPRTENHD